MPKRQCDDSKSFVKEEGRSTVLPHSTSLWSPKTLFPGSFSKNIVGLKQSFIVSKGLEASFSSQLALIRSCAANIKKKAYASPEKDFARALATQSVTKGCSDTKYLSHFPFLVLLRLMSYLSISDLSVILQLPNKRLRDIALATISRQVHEIKDLESLHTLLSHEGMIPMFYRSSATVLFGKHFMRLLPEAWHIMGPYYAGFLAFFMIILYIFPFSTLLMVFFIADTISIVKTWGRIFYTKIEILLSSESWEELISSSSGVTQASLLTRTSTLYLYTHAVRNLQLQGTKQSDYGGIMNSWSSYLYIMSSSYPNIRYLRISKCSLAWWFRLDELTNLRELVLEDCEVDESGMEIFSSNCAHLTVMRIISSRIRVFTYEPPLLSTTETQEQVCGVTPLQGKHNLEQSTQIGTNVFFPDLKHVYIKSCSSGIEPSAVYLLLLGCPNIEKIQFTDSKLLEEALAVYSTREIVNNEIVYVMFQSHIKKLKDAWGIT